MDSLNSCKELLDGLRDVLIWESDAAGKFTYVNEAAQFLLGYPLDRWLDGADVWTSLLHPEDQKWVRQLCVEETKKRRSYQCEFRFITADGRVLWVRKHAYLKTGSDGTSIGMRGVMIDITHEKRIAEEHARNDARYRIAMLGTRSVIWEWNFATNEFISTEAITELFAFPADKMKADIYFLYDNIHPDDRERVVLGIHSAVDEGEELWEDEFRFNTAAGAYVYVLSRGRIIRDEQGKPLRMIGATSDITQRKKMEQERYVLQRQERQALARAEHALKSQDEVMSVLSHDLKNPLSGILMNALLARRNLGGEANATQTLLVQSVERIYQGAVRMKNLIDDLIDLARAEAGRLKIDVDAILSSDLMQALIPEARRMLMERRGAALEVDVLDHGVSMMADRGRIQQVLLKILGYLAREGPPEATLKLRAGVLEDQVIFRIIHPTLIVDHEKMAHLFERKGGEMDLAIVRGVIQAHGGRIWASSTSDAGTSIYFTLDSADHYPTEKSA